MNPAKYKAVTDVMDELYVAAKHEETMGDLPPLESKAFQEGWKKLKILIGEHEVKQDTIEFSKAALNDLLSFDAMIETAVLPLDAFEGTAEKKKRHKNDHDGDVKRTLPNKIKQRREKFGIRTDKECGEMTD